LYVFFAALHFYYVFHFSGLLQAKAFAMTRCVAGSSFHSSRGSRRTLFLAFTDIILARSKDVRAFCDKMAVWGGNGVDNCDAVHVFLFNRALRTTFTPVSVSSNNYMIKNK
jgi:hypothetical protein